MATKILLRNRGGQEPLLTLYKRQGLGIAAEVTFPQGGVKPVGVGATTCRALTDLVETYPCVRPWQNELLLKAAVAIVK